jgi:hypothetical protein
MKEAAPSLRKKVYDIINIVEQELGAVNLSTEVLLGCQVSVDFIMPFLFLFKLKILELTV